MLTGIPEPEWPAPMVQHFSFRAPDWRWKRAVQWAPRTDRRRWNEEDEWTQEAAFALRPRPAWFRPTRPIAVRLARIAAARELSRAPLWQQALRQAWLLTGTSIEEVAKQMQEALEAVDWYERLFYEVRDRLNSISAIAGAVIGPQPPSGRMRAAWLLRRLAYFGGPEALKVAIPVLLPTLQGKRIPNGESLPYVHQIQRMLLDSELPCTAEILEALRPLHSGPAESAPLGTGWRAASSDRLSAALEAHTPQFSTGQVRTA